MNEMGTVNSIFCAPFSLAVGLRSYPKLIRDMKRDPAFAHDLFACLTDEILPSYLKAAVEYTGIKNWSGADAWAAYPNLTPELIEEWVVPYSNRLLGNTMKLGFAGMPIAGGDYCEEDLSKFDAEILWKTLDAQSHIIAGMPLFILAMGRWQDYPIEPVVEYLERFKQKGIPATVMASVNARVMRDGPEELIIKTARRFIDKLGRDFNLSAVGAASTPADTPSRHVHALVAAVHTYGQQPLAQDFDALPFAVPERAPFQEYVDKMSNGKGLTYQG
jgi:uroporphyrinogen-III decarboxylase